MQAGVFDEGIAASKLFQLAGLVQSGGEARRLIDQGGGYVNGMRLESFDQVISTNNINDMTLLLRAGKKRFHKIRILTEKNN